MKKILASTLALIMSVSLLTACGDEDSSSKADKSDSSSVSSAAESTEDSSPADDSPADSSEAESSDDESSTADDSSEADTKTGEAGALTKAYTEKLNSNSFSLEMKANALGIDTASKIKRNGEDFYVYLDFFGETIEVYKVGDKALGVIPSENSYVEIDPSEVGTYEQAVNTFGIDENATFVGTTEEDGFTVETYKVPMEMELEEGVTLEEGTDTDTEIKYYFDADGNLKKIVTNSFGMETTSEITSFETENVTIELPDTSSMTKVDPEAMENAEGEAEE
ncbi:MAG: hypothetical protein IJ555_01835 [Ruminococcus sp.]|nr:hypothetical protein [Ruminococcus sp.]